MFFGLINSSKPKVTKSTHTSYQDNMSTLSLAKNGYVSSSKRTKHIKANISLFITITTLAKLIFNTALLNKCGQMFSPNPYKVQKSD